MLLCVWALDGSHAIAPRERLQRLVRTVELAERGAEIGPGGPESRQAVRGGAKRFAGALHVVEPKPKFAALEVRAPPTPAPGAIASSRSRAAASRSLTSMQTLAVASKPAGVRPSSSARTQSASLLPGSSARNAATSAGETGAPGAPAAPAAPSCTQCTAVHLCRSRGPGARSVRALLCPRWPP